MITQILIKEDKDLAISNNYGDTEPFNSAIKAQLFSNFEYQALTGLDNQLIVKRKLRNHTRKYWQNLPFFKFSITEPIFEYIYPIFNKPKIFF